MTSPIPLDQLVTEERVCPELGDLPWAVALDDEGAGAAVADAWPDVVRPGGRRVRAGASGR